MAASSEFSVSVIMLDECGNLQYKNGVLVYEVINRRQLPPEDFNCPDLTYALQPSGVDDQGTKIFSLFRYLMQDDVEREPEVPATVTVQQSASVKQSDVKSKGKGKGSFKPPFAQELVENAQEQAENDEEQEEDVDDNANSNSRDLWPYKDVLLLIESYKKNKELLNNSAVTKVEVFKKVAAELKSHGVINTHQDCSLKIKNLIYRYKKVISSNNKTGQGRQPWKFTKQMADMLQGDPTITPVKLVSSMPLSTADRTTVKASSSAAVTVTLPTNNIPSASSSNSSSTNTAPIQKKATKKDNKLLDLFSALQPIIVVCIWLYLTNGKSEAHTRGSISYELLGRLYLG